MKKIYIIKTGLLLLLTAAFVAGCSKEEEQSPFAGNDNSIAAFTLVKDGVTLKGAVSPNAVVITAPERFSLSGAVASVTLSENADIEPDPSSITDWDVAQTFTVTSYNGIVNKYDYSVERHLVSRDGDVVLLTQADVEAFAAELDADQINGTLTVGATNGTDTVYSLASLAGRLKVITESVIINDTYAGGDLSGLAENLEKTNELRILSQTVKTVRFPKLVAIYSGLTIEKTYGKSTSVETIDFPELTGVDNGIKISQPDSLTTVNFPKLQRVSGSLAISGTSGKQGKLQFIDLPELTVVNGGINIYFTTAVERVTAPKLEIVETLTMYSCTMLAEIDFHSLKTVNGNLSIQSDVLTVIDFPVLETIDGDMSYSYSRSTALTELRLPALKSVGNITVPQVNYHELPQFPALKTVKNSLTIRQLNYTDLSAFSALDSIGSLSIQNLTELTSFAGLSSLRKIGSLSISGIPKVTEIDLRGIEIGSLTLSYNSSTTALMGDDELTGNLILSGDSIFNVTGFKKVNQVYLTTSGTADVAFLEQVTGMFYLQNGGGNLTLSRLKSIGSMQGYSYYQISLNMPELETVEGNFAYNAGYEIISISLPKLRSVAGNVSFTGLSATCPLETISCPALQSITGILSFSGNSSYSPNTKFSDLSGFSALTSANGVTINYLAALTNFEPLKNVIPSISGGAWKIAGCGYNPTYQDMLDGKYKN